jgi:hypothetical protein
MWIRTRPASANLHLEARVPTKDRPAPTQEYISFDLLPLHERDHLDLDTGEVFQDYNYALIRKNEKKPIYASMTIRQILDDSHYRYNQMRYFDEYDHHPSSIHFDVFIVPTAFCELVANLRCGLYPETITIELPLPTTRANAEKKAAMEFGWEPDGSGVIWHNKEKESRIIPIESVSFEYPLAKPRHDEERENRLLPMQFSTPADRINEPIPQIQASLAQLSKYARWITIGVVALAVMTAILMVKRGALF